MRGGAGTATRTVGLLGGILTYAVEAGIIVANPAHGQRKPKDNVRSRAAHRPGVPDAGRDAASRREGQNYATTVHIIRQIAPTGCRRSEIIWLMWSEADTDASCLRLIDSNEGTSIRPVELSVVEFLEAQRKTRTGFQAMGRTTPSVGSKSLEATVQGFPAVRCHASRPAA